MMRVMTRRTILVALLSWIAYTLSDGPTGEDLLGACSATVKQQDGGKMADAEHAGSRWCKGYLSGFLDAQA